MNAAESKGMQITIMGRSFRVACREDEQQGLLEAVDYLNSKMQEIRDQGKVIGLERIAIMAALNIAHELLSAQRASGFDSEAFERRMKSMAEAIDEAMSAQEHLF